MTSPDSIFDPLRDHLRRVGTLEQPFELMILNFSCLMPYYRQSKFVQAAQRYLEDSFTVQSKVSFVLPNLDVVLVYEKPEILHRQNLFYHLRELFTYDPLMSMETFGEVDDIFMQVFDVHENFPSILAKLDSLQAAVTAFLDKHKENRKARDRAKSNQDNLQGLVTDSDQENSSTTRESPTEEVARVGQLAEKYHNLDISAVLRRDLVIRHDPTAEEKYVFAFSLMDPSIRKLMTYRDQRIDADSMLMNRYLTHVLHFRLLDFLIKTDDIKLQRDLAFEVHPELVLHRRFARYDDKFAKGGQNRIMLLFSLSDIYADFRLFSFARRHLRERGYRLGLADTRYEALQTIDLGALGLDYLFLRAEADWAFHMNAKDSMVQREIRDIGPERIVLTNCIQPRMIDFAVNAGIKLMAGTTIRERFDLSRDRSEFREQSNSKGLSVGEGVRRRSRS